METVDQKALQREDVEQRPYLFRPIDRGWWEKNMHGTILTPVWVKCSPYEVYLLNQRHPQRRG